MIIRWIDLGFADSVPNNSHRVFEIENRLIAIYDVQGTKYAIEDQCTHDGNPLSDGPIEGLEIICARHGARFCLRTGAALSPPAYEPLSTFEVKIDDGRLLVALD